MVSHIKTGSVTVKGNNVGFTLIELLVVMAIIGSLMAIVAPNYLKQDDRAKETVLRHNLKTMRQALDDYRSDHDENPDSLSTLISAKYLRELPVDPIVGKNDLWVIEEGEASGVVDVRSAAKGVASDGSDYASW
jgi:general secretion pathway protein G